MLIEWSDKIRGNSALATNDFQISADYKCDKLFSIFEIRKNVCDLK